MRKTIVLIIILLFFGLFNKAFAFESGIADYGDLSFNEEQRLPGINEATVTFYSIGEKFGDLKPVPEIKLFCRYNDKGDITEVTQYTYRNRYSETKKDYLITDETFKDRFCYVYDNNKLIEKRKINKLDEEPDFLEYIYEKDELVNKEKHNKTGYSGGLYELYKYKYNDKGQLVGEASYNAQGNSIDEIEYLYDNAGNLVKKILYAPANTVVHERVSRGSINYKFNNSGRKVEEEKSDLFTLYEYDAQGRVIKEQYYTEDPFLPFDRTGRSRVIAVGYTNYVYDSEGRLSNKERKIAMQRGVQIAIMRYKYNEKGNIVEGDSYSVADGIETLRGLFKVEYK